MRSDNSGSSRGSGNSGGSGLQGSGTSGSSCFTFSATFKITSVISKNLNNWKID
jgi:hypothetical protein